MSVVETKKRLKSTVTHIMLGLKLLDSMRESKLLTL